METRKGYLVRTRIARRRAIAGGLLALVAATTVSLVAPQAALASSHGCTGIGPGLDVRNIGVRDGSSCVFVKGRGLEIGEVYASWYTATTPICNWWVDIDTPAEDSRFRHFQGSFHNGCTRFSGVIQPRPPAFLAKPGRVCATLFENAVVKGRSCVTIHS
ncbi:hypothetical protein [Actinoplanes sp. URMC 104]|uniref:hypothetical protein n=1 Tax=Actinoplanes sp. URMC 104 TaxID=3423409 RepID=UPI003F1A1533